MKILNDLIEMNRDKIVNVRLTEEEFNFIREQSKAMNINQSKFMRLMIAFYVRETNKTSLERPKKVSRQQALLITLLFKKVIKYVNVYIQVLIRGGYDFTDMATLYRRFHMPE